jgi:hypothetical protein
MYFSETYMKKLMFAALVFCVVVVPMAQESAKSSFAEPGISPDGSMKATDKGEPQEQIQKP